MKNTILKSIVVFLFTITLSAQVMDGYKPGLQAISKEEMKVHEQFLASDSMKGRAAGTDENLLAAMYLAEFYRKQGLQPVFETPRRRKEKDYAGQLKVEKSSLYEEYFQKFSLQKSQLNEKSNLTITKKYDNGSKEVSYELSKDFFLRYTGGTSYSVSSPIVFAGYGIYDGEDGYTDYVNVEGDSLDVKNKIVLVVDSYPRYSDSSSAFRKANELHYRMVKHKAKYALNKGAEAVFVVQSPLLLEQPIDAKYEKTLGLFERTYTKLHDRKRSELPVFYLTEKIATQLFDKLANVNLKEVLQGIDTKLKPHSFEFQDITAEFNIVVDYEILRTQNVVAYLEGSDPELKDEIVVFCAHYDHIGIGEYGAMDKSRVGEIHNGADDNGSGTAGLLELAKAFSKTQPRRSALFISFSAEENGLLGSKFYVNNQPLFPLEKTVAVVNLDMIGRNEPELVWVGGAFYGRDIIKTAEEANKLVGMELLYNVGFLGNASDQAPFLWRDIPALFFFAGLHDDYHTPDDDIEKLNFDKMKKITELSFLSGWILTNQDKNPVYEDIPIPERAVIVKESVKRQKNYKKEN